MPETITLEVYRYRPDQEERPTSQTYTVPYHEDWVVLDALNYLKDQVDGTLSYRWSCRMGVCGSCGMFINGHPRLACNTQITELGTSLVTVAPLPNFAIIRDLVPDLRPMFDKHAALMPHIIRDDVREMYEPTGEYFQTPHELEQFLQFSYCIKCGCCGAACPTVATDPAYSGPMALAQSHRYNADSRDGGFGARKQVLATEKGPWKCHYAGECSQACPKGVDPARAIQLMKRQLVFDYLKLYKQPCPSKVVAKPTEIKRRADVPEAPEATI
jgi:succinate dehydrogenase/fumarate reductase iron-sulfur protein